MRVKIKSIIGQIELTTKGTKICSRKNITLGLMRKNLTVQKYLRSQYIGYKHLIETHMVSYLREQQSQMYHFL